MNSDHFDCAAGHHNRSIARRSAGVGLLALAALLQACATSHADIADRINALPPADVILLGEQHDAADHQHLQRATVLELVRRQRLAALLIEMAEQGKSTLGLPRNAPEAQVQAALQWRETGWPWADYGPVVMTAVRSGVPVLGANLPREAMRAAMTNLTLDTLLSPRDFAQQRDNIRSGHCMLLPDGQISPMTRIQIARDVAMASAIADAVRPGKTVLLVAGGGHVARGRGVPAHLPAALQTVEVLAVAGKADAADRVDADVVWETPALPPKDHCAALENQLKR